MLESTLGFPVMTMTSVRGCASSAVRRSAMPSTGVM